MLPGHIIRNTALNVAAWAVTLIASICTWALISHAFAPVEMGQYGYATWLSALLVTLATLGLPTAVQKYVSEYMGRGDAQGSADVIRRLLRAQVFAALAITLVGTAVFALIRPALETSTLVLVVASAAPGAIQLTVTEVLRGFQRFAQAARISLACSGAQVVAVALAISLSRTIASILIANLFITLLSASLAFRALRPAVSMRNRVPGVISDEAGRRIWRFTVAFSYTCALEYVIWDKVEIFFLERYSSMEQVAYYSIAFALGAKVIGVANALTAILLPISSHYHGSKSTFKIAQLYQHACRFVLLILLPICAAGILLGRPAITIIYGKPYTPVYAPLFVLLAGIPFASLSAVGWAVISAMEQPSSIVKIMTIGVPLNLALDWYFIRHYGAVGAAIANTAAQMFIAFLLLAFAARYASGIYPWRRALKGCFCILIAMSPALLLQSHLAILCVAVLAGLAIYPSLLFLVRELGATELGSLKSAFVPDLMDHVAAVTDIKIPD